MHELCIFNKNISYNLHILILLESKIYILIHHTLLDLLVHGTAGKCGFEPHFWHLFFIEIFSVIFNSCYIVLTGYMFTMFVLNDYVYFYKVVLHIYLPINLSSSAAIWNPDHAGDAELQPIKPPRARSSTRCWLFIYEHIHSFWHWIIN